MKLKKILTIIITMIIIIGVSNIAFATENINQKQIDIQSESIQVASKYKIDPDKYKAEPSIDENSTAIDLTQRILGIINVIGIIIFVATLMIVGIKYMVGSISERAEYKKTMVPILIGGFLLFLLPTMINVIYSLIVKVSN